MDKNIEVNWEKGDEKILVMLRGFSGQISVLDNRIVFFLTDQEAGQLAFQLQNILQEKEAQNVPDR